MADTAAEQIIKEVEREQADRSNYDDHCAQVARRVLTRHDNFQGKNTTKGTRRSEWQFDSQAPVALQRFSAAMLSFTFPPNERYHGLQTENRAVRDYDENKRYCETSTDVLFDMRYAAKANFAGTIAEIMDGIGGFGTAIMMMEDNPGRPVNYLHCALPKTWMKAGADGRINWMYRELNYTAHRAIEEFGRGNLPEAVISAATHNPTREFPFYHRVMPNFHRQAGMWGPAGMSFVSEYASKEGKAIVGRGGFRTFPFAVARYVVAGNELYGRSPAMLALADIKMRNEMKRTVLRASHRMAEPILLLGDDTALAPFQMQPGSRNKGYIKGDGTELAKQLRWEGDLAPALQILDDTGRVINDVFLVYLFQILIETPTMTATEVLERAREKGILLTPFVGRIQSEFQGAMIERELDIAQARGLLPEMPLSLQQAGGLVAVTYDSPLNRAQKAEQALGFVRTLETILPFAEQDPTILKRFNLDKIMPELAQINGMPLSWMHTDDEWKGILKRMEQAQSAQEMAAMAQPLAAAAKDAAQARVFSQQAA